MNPTPQPTADVDALLDRAGFDLRQVTWGYQELFRDIIRELARNGFLSPANDEVTRAFFETLQHGDKSTFDSVLKAFLEALDGDFRWLMRLPRLFERWSKTGLRLARRRHFLGMRFFELTGRGELGQTPGDLEFVLDITGLLLEKEPELVGPFLQGCRFLLQHLGHAEVRRFVLDAWRLFHRNPNTARGFLTCELDSARRRIEEMGRRVDLTHEHDALERLAQALLGRRIEIDNLGRLDADELQERGSVFVGCSVGFYLPETIAEFPTRQENRDCLRALTALGACALLADGFAVVHGTAHLETCRDLFPGSASGAESLGALFAVVEAVRIVRFAEKRFPGLRPWVRRLINIEFAMGPPRTLSDHLLADCLGVGGPESADSVRELAARLPELAAESAGWRDTRRLVQQLFGNGPTPDLGGGPLRPLCFLPDPFFPLTISAPPGDRTRIDLRDVRPAAPEEKEQAAQTDDRDREQPRSGSGDADGRRAEEVDDGKPRALAGYYYDEWNVHCGDYYRDWCCVHEHRPRQSRRALEVSKAVQSYADQVRHVFERLKPQDIHVETRLAEGDDIHLDHFMEYVSERDVTPDTSMRFYSKPLTRKRDVAAAVLLDLSGSTAERCDRSNGRPSDAKGQAVRLPPRNGGLEFDATAPGKTVIEVEKEAAFVLASGLASLGDRFGVYGFTGAGRENCQFYVFKEFEERWDRNGVRELLSATPGSSTRIGAALRHAGWKLAGLDAKTKLLLLITDGKPCDQGYETETHYAHHDVRRACRENATRGIHTFCVSTAENTPADMELMFPDGRYLILEDIARLPAVLSRLYLRLTR